ncbi:hypothetical protein [Streptomyces fungicidicus]|uniref:hypothetical protein n=1 Tax=Streptomyces fungicidicus TaxID=68203 RepID=UPI003D71EA44
MKQLPTPRTQPPSPAVVRALADIETATQDAEPAVAEVLGLVAELIVQHGDPAPVFDRVINALAREEIKALSSSHCLTLHTTRAAAQATELHVIWTATGGLAIVPRSLSPRVVLEQLRAAIAELEEEERLTAGFQASVASGYVEAVEDWAARIADKAGS